MSQQATKISQPIRDSRLLAGQKSRTFGSEIKQGNAYFRLEDEEIVDYVSSTGRLYFATERFTGRAEGE